jgi:hypothetical protein
MSFEWAMRGPFAVGLPFANAVRGGALKGRATQEHRLKPVLQKKAPRLAAAPLQNHTRIGPKLLGLFGGFLVGLLGFLCHENLLPSFSRLLHGQAKRRNRHAARCNCYTGASGKSQENFAVFSGNRDMGGSRKLFRRMNQAG